jgi:hypothetical protein
MAAEQSQFSRLPKKQLAFISEKLVDEEFPIGNPYDDFDSAYITLQEVSRYFNIEASQEDVEFFAKFLEINDDLIADLFANNREQMNNRELIEQLKIPVAKSYKLDYSAWGTCSYTNYMSQEFDSYDKDWVKDSATQQNNDGDWNMWEGEERASTDYENFEESDYDFDDVYEINDDGTSNYLGDSILDRLVIENTSNVVKSLDKRTLIKLKSIIESRLRVL